MRQSTYSLNSQKFLSVAERADLVRVLEMRKVKDQRDVTLLYLLMHTGARASEALMVRPCDLNDTEQTVFLRGLKGSSDRELPLPPWLYLRLKAERQRCTGARLFPIGYNRLRDIWAEFKPVNKKLHCLRHTFALQVFMKTKDLRLVQLALGHKSINNTMIYMNYVYSTQELRRILI